MPVGLPINYSASFRRRNAAGTSKTGTGLMVQDAWLWLLLWLRPRLALRASVSPTLKPGQSTLPNFIECLDRFCRCRSSDVLSQIFPCVTQLADAEPCITLAISHGTATGFPLLQDPDLLFLLQQCSHRHLQST